MRLLRPLLFLLALALAACGPRDDDAEKLDPVARSVPVEQQTPVVATEPAARPHDAIAAAARASRYGNGTSTH